RTARSPRPTWSRRFRWCTCASTRPRRACWASRPPTFLRGRGRSRWRSFRPDVRFAGRIDPRRRDLRSGAAVVRGLQAAVPSPRPPSILPGCAIVHPPPTGPAAARPRGEDAGMSGRVLVTGGAGFIGSHVAEAYLAAGWEVTVLDDLSRGRERNVPKRARLVRADIRSAEARKLLLEGRFDVLNHHAAQIDVRVSVARPAFDADVNVVGFVNLLEGAGEGGVRRVIFASSGGVVYGETDIFPTPQRDVKRPVSPYGVSKLAGEYYLRALGALRGFEGVAMRYANVYGPRQDPHSEAGVVSIFVSRILENRPLTIFGDGRQTRDYVYVRDVARANVLASTCPVPPGDGIDGAAFN